MPEETKTKKVYKEKICGGSLRGVSGHEAAYGGGTSQRPSSNGRSSCRDSRPSPVPSGRQRRRHRCGAATNFTTTDRSDEPDATVSTAFETRGRPDGPQTK